MPPTPFTALTLIAAPAVLTNATALLISATQSRYNAVTERFSRIAQELAAPDVSPHLREVRLLQITRNEKRASLLLGALRCYHFALALFAASALVALLGAALSGATSVNGSARLSFDFGVFALLVGATAVLSLIAGCAYSWRESHLAMLNVRETVALLHEKYAPEAVP